MHSLLSFSSIKSYNHCLVKADNLRLDDESTLFLLDTGATVSLIGLNTICDDDVSNQHLLKNIIHNCIENNEVIPSRKDFKTATQENVTVYPCIKRNVTIMETEPIDFYFHIYMGNIYLPLLGNDYLDDCKYHHNIEKSIEVLAVADNVGKRFYPPNVIDFDRVLNEYYHSV